MKRVMTVLTILLSVSCTISITLPAQQDRSGPAISLHSDVYLIGTTWYCPLCRQAVDNGDRSRVDLKLCLSEWHDVMIDRDYFDAKIRYISDEELVNSLDIPAIDPALRRALGAGDHGRMSAILNDYYAARADNNRLSLYDKQNKQYFRTTEDFQHEVRADTARTNTIIGSARQCYTPERGFTLHGVHWGKRIDFNHTYPQISKWGVHYLAFLDDLTTSYLLTEDPATAGAFDDVFNQWYDQLDSVKQEAVINHTKSYDFIWYELGLANRTEKLINAQRVFRQHVSPETTTRLLKNILGSARWLNQCLEKTPFHPYNWQTHTALTLSYAAVAFPEFRESGAWLDRGRNNMILHLENDILNDGGYVERTTSYAEYMFTVYYKYMLMLQYFNNDPSLRNRYLSRIEKYIEFFTLTTSPLGVNSPFNDAARSKALVQVFKEMGVFFNRGDFVGAVRHEFSPEALASMPVTVTVPRTTSVDFPDSRFVVMRDSWDPASYFMIVNYGDFQNHCHYDALSFEVYANGIPIALDAGLGELGYLDPQHVSWYKHPLSHNMVTINQAVPEKMDMPGYDKIWSPQRHTEYFAATHDGYLRYQKAQHRRHIVFAKTRYWLIIDEVHTAGANQEMDFNFHTPCTMEEIDDGFISTQDKGFLIKQDRRDMPSVSRIKSTGSADLRGLPDEPSHRDIDWLIFRKALKDNHRTERMATLIYPFASKGQRDPASVFVEKLDLKDETATGYRVRIANSEDIIILSDGKYRKFTDTIEGDFTCVRINSTAGQVGYAGFSNVSQFRIDGVAGESFKTRRDFEYTK